LALRHLPFRHGAVYRPAQAPILAPSYHCSRYNLNTGRLTPTMFTALFRQVRSLVDGL
jgi:uracil-DNA glycosylase